MVDKKFVFICGLHKSGTSILHKMLREHPRISGFKNTGVPEDEGQHLQTVFSTALPYGGPGKFAFFKKARLNEKSPLVTEENKNKLFNQWKKYWNLEKDILLEKSPINLLRTRFLQEMFENSYFIIIKRHPIAVSYATRKWWRWFIYTWKSLIKHWVTAYEIFEQDKEFLNNYYVVKYEDITKDTHKEMGKICSFIGIENFSIEMKMRSDINRRYFNRWKKDCKRKLFRKNWEKIINKFEYSVNRLGYTLKSVE
ncbi:MAG: sulfotransferase [Atribacterota bacterium]